MRMSEIQGRDRRATRASGLTVGPQAYWKTSRRKDEVEPSCFKSQIIRKTAWPLQLISAVLQTPGRSKPVVSGIRGS